MDIYRFIDSSAMRAYLKEQNYPFSTQEAAFLVYSCKTATLAEKAQAWEEIIRTMPNCSMEKRLNMEAIPDFHAFLRHWLWAVLHCRKGTTGIVGGSQKLL